MVKRAFGTWLHRLMVRHPAAHAELLNQYRSSEDFAKRYPRTVCTELLPEGPLRTKYAKHQADEERHEALYAERIAALGGAPRAVGPARDYMLAVWRSVTSGHLGIHYARFGQRQPLSANERLNLFALQVAVEERGLAEMALHRAACEAAGDGATVQLIAALEPDERYHAAYSRAALQDAASELVSDGVVAVKMEDLPDEQLDTLLGDFEAAMGQQDVESLALTAARISTARRLEDAAYRSVTAAFLRELLAGPLAAASKLECMLVSGLAWLTDPGTPPDEAGGAW